MSASFSLLYQAPRGVHIPSCQIAGNLLIVITMVVGEDKAEEAEAVVVESRAALRNLRTTIIRVMARAIMTMVGPLAARDKQALLLFHKRETAQKG
jgi:hypothetical protein